MKKLFFKRDWPLNWRNLCIPLLALSWCFGLLLGVMAANDASNILIPMMREAVFLPASIPGLLAAALLPFLFSAFAVSLSKPWLLLIISTFKAFSFGFCACGVNLAFGSAGWLVRLLFLFSDCCILPVLCLYWIRHISGKAGQRWELPCCIVYAVLVGSIDYCLISPFLVKLISN